MSPTRPLLHVCCPDAASDFDSSGVSKAFENLDADQLPESPIFLEMTPDGKHWWIAGLMGTIIQVLRSSHSISTQTLIKSRTQDMHLTVAGTLVVQVVRS